MKVLPTCDDCSGIYVFERYDENGILYFYVGQAKNLLNRLASHLNGYQHIDLSLKKRKWYSEKNPYGWKVFILERCPIEVLDEREKYYFVEYAKKGGITYNKTSGGQDSKQGLDNQKSSKGYYDGIKQGEKKTREYIKNMLNYVDITAKQGKIAERKYKEFIEFIKGE